MVCFVLLDVLYRQTCAGKSGRILVCHDKITVWFVIVFLLLVDVTNGTTKTPQMKIPSRRQKNKIPHGGYKIVDSDLNDGINATTVGRYCSIPIYDLNKTPVEKIAAACFNAGKPCIINNVKHFYTDPVTKKTINLYEEFNKTNFLKKYGKLVLRQNSPGEVPFSLPTGEMTTVKEYFETGVNEEKFVFGVLHIIKDDNEQRFPDTFKQFSNIIKHATQTNVNGTNIFKDFTLPKREDANKKGRSTIFSLGGKGGGITYHDHGSTILNLIHGVKIWYLYEPGTRSDRIHKQRYVLYIKEAIETISSILIGSSKKVNC